jgi:putative transposase
LIGCPDSVLKTKSSASKRKLLAPAFVRDFWLELWEKEAIIDFHLKNPSEGYRRLTFMMLDAGVVAVSPASVWRVLQQAGLLSR